MNAKEVKDDRKYTKDHEWAKLDADQLRVGITAFAVDQLGDVTLVNFDVAPGDRLEAGKAFGTIESVKTLSDLFAPVSGTVLELNEKLEDSPELVNSDCYADGWMILLQCDPQPELQGLMSSSEYLQYVEQSEH